MATDSTEVDKRARLSKIVGRARVDVTDVDSCAPNDAAQARLYINGIVIAHAPIAAPLSHNSNAEVGATATKFQHLRSCRERPAFLLEMAWGPMESSMRANNVWPSMWRPCSGESG